MLEECELTKEEKHLVGDMVQQINGDIGSSQKYEEPPIPHTIPEDLRLEYLTKALSEHELGRYIAHRLLDTTFTEVKKDE